LNVLSYVLLSSSAKHMPDRCGFKILSNNDNLTLFWVEGNGLLYAQLGDMAQMKRGK
jgi:hypothetical protein